MLFSFSERGNRLLTLGMLCNKSQRNIFYSVYLVTPENRFDISCKSALIFGKKVRKISVRPRCAEA